MLVSASLTINPGADAINKISSAKLCYACFKRYDWLLKIFQPIVELKTSVA